MSSLLFYLQYPFVRYALIVGVLIALCSSLLGVTLVLKRFSFIGDGLSHVAFGAMAVATVCNIVNDTWIVMPITIVAAVLLLGMGQNAKIRGDAAIGMLSVGALAIGYMLMNVFSTSANISGDVCTTLFGSTSILTLTKEEVILCIVMSIVVVVFYVLFYNRIFAVTFDEDFVRATGKNAKMYHMLIAAVTAVIIVLAMNLVGSLLVSALIIFPAVSAMQRVHSFRGVVIYAAVLSVIGAFAGMLISILCSTPVGATIVVMDIVLFALNCVGAKKPKALATMVCLCLLLSGCVEDVKGFVKEESTESISESIVEEENTEGVSESLVEEQTIQECEKSNEVNYDLTLMGSDMVYATVYQLMVDPQTYEGKTFKIEGQYYPAFYEPTQKYYHYCLITDAMACCSQGLEFVWEDGTHSYPEEYPQPGEEVIITGRFETYQEDGNTSLYCRLQEAKLEVVKSENIK